MKIDDFPDDAWICEQHPDWTWPHPNPAEPNGQCAGPGMLRAAAESDAMGDVLTTTEQSESGDDGKGWA